MNDEFDDDDRPEIDRLAEQNMWLRDAWKRAKDDGDEARAREILEQSGPVKRRLRELRALGATGSVCPIRWIIGAPDEAVEDKIRHPGLQAFARREDATSTSTLLLGPTGIGKSTAAALALRRGINANRVRSRDVVWRYARALAQAARLHPLGEGECRELTEARRAGLLVLDDLGLERDPAELVDVIHDRYEHGRPTWTTSGLQLAELNQRYGEALVRRLVEGGGGPARVVSAFPKEVK